MNYVGLKYYFTGNSVTFDMSLEVKQNCFLTIFQSSCPVLVNYKKSKQSKETALSVYFHRLNLNPRMKIY